MLIYNHEKELIGIDANDLNTLGFKNLAQLKAETSDFADLFVKKAGFIHNFEHVHWIDFVHTASDVDSISEVIIKTKEKQYQATLQIESIYLNDEPSLSAFIVYLQDLKDINAEIISTEIEYLVEDKPDDIEEDLDKLEEKEYFALPKNEIIKDNPIEEKVEVENHENLYIFNPIIASQELGLSVDVVEGFINDFIKQAKEAKSLLYKSLKDEDIDSVKFLINKLKGISANLRVDDIFNILTHIININDKDELEKSLDNLYEKIDNLSTRKDEQISDKVEIEKLSDDIFSQKIEIKSDEEEIFFETIEIMYDKNSVANELGISHKNFEELFHDFIIESKVLSDAINDAILEDNHDFWIIEAIKFKGISKNMRLYNCAKELDKIIQTKDKDLAQESINKIDLAIKNIANT